MSEENLIFNMELNVEAVFNNSRKLELIIGRIFGYLDRLCEQLGVPKNSPFSTIFRQARNLTMIIRQLHTAAMLMQMASGPIGVAMAGSSLVGTASTIGMATDSMMALGE